MECPLGGIEKNAVKTQKQGDCPAFAVLFHYNFTTIYYHDAFVACADSLATKVIKRALITGLGTYDAIYSGGVASKECGTGIRLDCFWHVAVGSNGIVIRYSHCSTK